MVLESFGVFSTEEKLRELCDCTYDSAFLGGGTDAFKLKFAAHTLGFAKTQIANLTFDELKAEVERGLYPIVYIKTRMVSNASLCLHAVVVVGIKDVAVEVLDPACGEQTLAIESFLQVWRRTRYLTILVET